MTPTSSVQAQTSSAPAAKQAGNAPAEVPFNQVLSGEMANRRDSASADNSGNQTTDNKGVPDQQATTTTVTPGTKETKPAETADAQLKDGKDNKDSNAAPAVSVDLMALVGNLSQAPAKSVNTGVSQPEPDAPAAIGIGKGTGSAQSILQKSRIAAQLDGSTENTPALKPEIALTAPAKQAGEIKPTLDPATLKLEPAKLQDIPPNTTPAGLAPLQQASVNIAQAITGLPGEKLTPKVGTPAWDQALGQKIVWMAAGSQQSASLTLNPPDLGPLQVVLHVTNDQANATFISAHPDVRHALEAALPKLREMMGDAGIQLGQSTVSAGMPNQHDARGGSSRHTSPGFRDADGAIDSAIQSGHAQIRVTGLGTVDTFA
ncbi:flagellar hook-length control protein FliK [Sulfuriferula multivorans]|uniref:Flagellar hook-length control protein FliK n=1 Tax=Sulfuriferula multivorans TaxID=1559896 RepID=A0A401JD90_9PROT|nr:flagellar hook-length control protein FliK [Sulfuriferula multivorans]GBL45638.1 flagellar hook-length control protein FliK [Sulfuriferula multivorans]